MREGTQMGNTGYFYSYVNKESMCDILIIQRFSIIQQHLYTNSFSHLNFIYLINKTSTQHLASL